MLAASGRARQVTLHNDTVVRHWSVVIILVMLKELNFSLNGECLIACHRSDGEGGLIDEKLFGGV